MTYLLNSIGKAALFAGAAFFVPFLRQSVPQQPAP